MRIHSLPLLNLLIALLAACGGHPTQHEQTKQTQRLGHFLQGIQSPTMSCDWLRLHDSISAPKHAFPWATYGREIACLQGFTEAHPDAHLHVHASNGVCIRNKNCGPAEATTMPQIITRAIEIIEFVRDECPDCSADIVVQLEDQMPSAEACHIASKIREAIGLMGVTNEITIWRNPVRAALIDDATRNCFDGIELHGEEFAERAVDGVARCAASNDGADIQLGFQTWQGQPVLDRDQAIRAARGSGRCDFYFWTSAGNCLSRASWLSPYPADRDCSGLDPGVIDALREIFIAGQG